MQQLIESKKCKEVLLDHLYQSLILYCKDKLKTKEDSMDDMTFIEQNQLLYEYIQSVEI